MKNRFRFVALVGFALAIIVGTTVHAAPSNNNFASATALTGPAAKIGGTTGDTNVGATGEAGEPNHAGTSWPAGCTASDQTNGGQACNTSVWYTWTAPTSAAYTVDLCQSNLANVPSHGGNKSDFDSTLAVYTGTAVNALTEVVSNDDTGDTANCTGPSSVTSKVVFTTTSATTYKIAVSGNSASTGTIFGLLEACSASGANCLAPAATNSPASSVGQTTATLNGVVNPEGQSTTYQFHYAAKPGVSCPALSNNAPMSAVTIPQTDMKPHAESTTVTGLATGTTYCYQISATNGSGTTNATPIQEFTTTSQPTDTTTAATNVHDTSATLNGFVNGQGDGTTQWHFEYDTHSDFSAATNTADTTVSSPTGDHAVSANITGLTSKTTYFFRIVATNVDGTTRGTTRSFTTPSAVTNDVNPATVTATTATITGVVNPEGQNTNAFFQYGPGSDPHGTTTAAAAVPIDSSDHPESANLVGLTPGTTYVYRMVLQDASTSAIVATGADKTFSAGPLVMTDPATNVTATSATLNGTVNPEGSPVSDIHFQWGTDSSFTVGPNTHTAAATPSTLPSGNSDQAVSANITGLTGGTDYFFRVVATNGNGTSTGGTLDFGSGGKPVVPVIVSGGADLNGDGVVNGMDDSSGFFGNTQIIDGKLDCNAWGSTRNAGTAGNGVINSSDNCTLLAFDGTQTGQTISVVAGAFQLSDGPMPAVYPNPSTPNDGTVKDAKFAWQTLSGKVDSNGDGTIDENDCAFGLIGTSATAGPVDNTHAVQILGNDSGDTNPCGFGAPHPTSANNGLVDLNNDNTITSLDTCATGCFFGHNVTTGVVQDLSPPQATTGAGTNVTATSATLNGVVNPEGAATSFHFEWATSTAYENSTPETAVTPTDTANHSVSADLTGLVQGQTYHYRVVARSAGGTVSGADKTLYTCGACKDYDEDGRTDVFYWNRNSGHTAVWFMGGADGSVKQSSSSIAPGGPGFPNPSWIPVTSGDFNRDGKTDILYWNKNTGHTVVWFMGGSHGVVKQSSSAITPDSAGYPSLSWVPQAVGDFNKDGMLDILYWNKKNGHTTVWFMGGANGIVKQSSSAITPDSSGYPSTSWVATSVSDFDGDGSVDIFYANRGNGNTSVWFMGGTNGVVKQSSSAIDPGSAGYPSLSWVPVSTADFDQDGASDIFYWNSKTGKTAIWYMGGSDGTQKQSSTTVSPGGAGFPNTPWIPVT